MEYIRSADLTRSIQFLKKKNAHIKPVWRDSVEYFLYAQPLDHIVCIIHSYPLMLRVTLAIIIIKKDYYNVRIRGILFFYKEKKSKRLFSHDSF